VLCVWHQICLERLPVSEIDQDHEENIDLFAQCEFPYARSVLTSIVKKMWTFILLELRMFWYFGATRYRCHTYRVWYTLNSNILVQLLYFQFLQQQALDLIPKNYTKTETRDANFIYLVTCPSSSSGVHEENSMSVLISISSL
jgi:hypothetical protein